MIRRITLISFVSLCLIAYTLNTKSNNKTAKNETDETIRQTQSQATQAKHPQLSSLGNNLRIERQGEQIISITSNLGEAKVADFDFNPNDLETIKRRALQVLRTIGISNKNLRAHFRQGQYSAQAFYKQHHDGLPVQPGGNLTLDFGPKGELLGLYSDLIKDIRPENDFLIEAPNSDDKQPGSSPAEKVIWALHDQSTGKTQARRAYSYFSQGQRSIIDAETGKTLYRRDERQF